VYKLTDFVPSQSTSEISILRLDDAENGLDADRILDHAEDVWGYDSLKKLNNPHVLAKIDGQVVGGARANEVTAGHAVVGGVKAFKEFRSKGVGTAVSSALVSLLVEMELKVFLETDEHNFPAKRIYEKLGFVEVGSSHFMDIGTTVIKDAIIGDRDY